MTCTDVYGFHIALCGCCALPALQCRPTALPPRCATTLALARSSGEEPAGSGCGGSAVRVLTHVMCTSTQASSSLGVTEHNMFNRSALSHSSGTAYISLLDLLRAADHVEVAALFQLLRCWLAPSVCPVVCCCRGFATAISPMDDVKAGNDSRLDLLKTNRYNWL